MSGLDLRLEGVATALKRLEKKPAQVRTAGHLACVRGAHVLEGAIKLHIRQNPHELASPDRRGQTYHEGLIDTGAMLNSVSVTPLPNGAEVGPRVEYAAYHEYGTVKMPARPFMQPALDEKRAEVERMVRDAVERELRK